MSNAKIVNNSYMVVADRILTGSFGVYGKGNFDLNVEELAEVLKIAMGADNRESAKIALEDYLDNIK